MIEDRLKATLKCDAISGDAFERGVVGKQIAEAITVITDLRHRLSQQNNVSLLQRLWDDYCNTINTVSKATSEEPIDRTAINNVLDDTLEMLCLRAELVQAGVDLEGYKKEETNGRTT